MSPLIIVLVEKNVYDNHMIGKSNKESFDVFSSVLNSAIYIAVATALTTLIASAFQLGYFSYFGIDPTIIGIQIDTFSMISSGGLIASVLVMVVVIWAVTHKLKEYKRENPIGFTVTADVLVVIFVALTTFAFFKLRNEDTPAIVVYANVIILILVPIILVILLILSMYLSKKHNQRFLTAHAQLYEDLFSDDSKPKSKNFNLLILILPIVMVPALYMGSVNGGLRVAKAQRHFTAIESEKPDELNLVLGRTSAGIIVKRYNTTLKAYEKGYRVLANKDRSYTTVEIK